MEKKSLINLIEDEIDKDEDDEREDDLELDRLKKRYQLAFSILNFITRKKAKETEPEEDQILSDLFVPASKNQIEEIDLQIKTEDPLKLAGSLVESRIEQLEKQTKQFSDDPKIVLDHQSKIKDLEDIQYYLMSDQINPEIVSISTIDTKQESTESRVETIIPSFSRQEPSAQLDKKSPHKTELKPKTKLKRVKSRPKQKTSEKKNRAELIESLPAVTGEAIANKPVKKDENVVLKPELKNTYKTIVPEPLTEARKQIDQVYSHFSSINRPKTEIKTTQTVEIEPEFYVSEPSPKIPEIRYRDIAKRITVDNLSLRQFFNKNHFNEQARKRIIDAILGGEKPASVLGKEMTRRGKFKSLIGSSLTEEKPPIKIPSSPKVTTLQLNYMPSTTKIPQIVRLSNPRIWSIIIILLLIIGLIGFMVIK
jgi:hypothetical protein